MSVSRQGFIPVVVVGIVGRIEIFDHPRVFNCVKPMGAAGPDGYPRSGPDLQV